MEILSEDMKQKYNIFNEDWKKLYSELHMLNTADGAKRRVEELLSRTNNFIMNEVANNSLFSLEDYKRQVENDKQGYYETVEYHNKQIGEQQAKNLAQMQKEKHKQNCIPQCHICGSTNTNKITIGDMAVKTAVFGVVGAVDDAGKPMELIQHVQQLNFLLMVVPKPDPEKPKRTIGFVGQVD